MNPDNPYQSPQQPVPQPGQTPLQPGQPNPAAPPQITPEYVPRYVIPQEQNLPPKSSVAYPWVPVTGPDTAQFAAAEREQALSEPSQAPSSPPQKTMEPGIFPQYGDPMAVLPPIGGNPNPPLPPTAPIEQPPVYQEKPKRAWHKWLFVALLGVSVLALLTLVILLATHHTTKKTPPKKTTTQRTVVKPVHYDADAITQLLHANQLNATALTKLNKTNTFYTAFRAAAQQPTVRTKWDVYYTKRQNDARGDQYAMYDVTVDYKSKAYDFSEDDYNKVITLQSRCIGAKQYIFDASKATTAAQKWQPASDNSSCSMASVANRMNDGLNVGGLDSTQSDTFIQQLNKSGAVRVNSMTLVPGKTPLLKFDVNIVPQKSRQGFYEGMQNLQDALRAAGIFGNSQPYAYFGSASEGAHLTYYVDPATMLPMYASMSSTPAYDAHGRQVNPASWSHRFIEYTFPLQIASPSLDDHQPVGFSAWPDH